MSLPPIICFLERLHKRKDQEKTKACSTINTCKTTCKEVSYSSVAWKFTLKLFQVICKVLISEVKSGIRPMMLTQNSLLELHACLLTDSCSLLFLCYFALLFFFVLFRNSICCRQKKHDLELRLNQTLMNVT